MLRLIQSISFVLIMAGFEQLAYYQPKSDSKETISPAQKQDSSPDDSFDIVREAKKRDFTKDLLKFSENEQQIEGFEEYQGILSKEEIQGLIGKSERNRYTLLASLNDQIV